MAGVTAIFWDIGGVILSNGWDRHLRRLACQQFELDGEEFEDRHELVISEFETGAMTFDQYLKRTVFYRFRSFTTEGFKEFIFSHSQPNVETLKILEELAGSCRYLLGTLNNESRELNDFRIERFGLRRYFSVFFTSCFLGLRKPDEGIYRRALELTQRSGNQCLFIDDRALNIECAGLLGMRTIHFHNPAQLRDELQRHGIELTAATGARA